MDNFDLILYVCYFAVAAICALLVSEAIRLLYDRRKRRKKLYPHGAPWYWRAK